MTETKQTKLKATMPIYGVSEKKKTHEMEVR